MSEKDYSIYEQGQAMWSILDTAIDGIIIINSRGRIQIANKAVEKMFGHKLSEMTGENVSMLMSTHDRVRHDQYLTNYLTTQEPKIIGIGREVVAKHKDGNTFPIRLAISEVILNGELYFTGILHDLSAQKHAEQQLLNFTQELESKVQLRTEELGDVINQLLKVNKQYQTEIKERIEVENQLKRKEEELKTLLDKEKEINQMKSRFVSMASHEFRTPLSTVLSSAALIEKYTQTDQQDKREKHVNKIKNSVNNLTNILNDFLSLGKLEEGTVVPVVEEIDIEIFCQELVEELSVILKQGQIIKIETDQPSKPLISDPRFLYNSLVNILSNAIKYSDAHHEIWLKAKVNEGEFIFEVVDKGMGIPEKEQVHLFNRFFRAQNATNIQGTGLGLHIVKRYMELLGGRVSFESEYNVGSTFRLHLPLRERNRN